MHTVKSKNIRLTLSERRALVQCLHCEEWDHFKREEGAWARTKAFIDQHRGCAEPEPMFVLEQYGEDDSPEAWEAADDSPYGDPVRFIR